MTEATEQARVLEAVKINEATTSEPVESEQLGARSGNQTVHGGTGVSTGDGSSADEIDGQGDGQGGDGKVGGLATVTKGVEQHVVEHKRIHACCTCMYMLHVTLIQRMSAYGHPSNLH